MDNKINIAEILKDCPKGTKLYSPLLGECELWEVDNTSKVIVRSSDTHNIYCFTKTGTFLMGEQYSEFLLFPSKDCRTWENFKTPWKHKHFEPFQKVLVDTNGIWRPDIYSYFSDYSNHQQEGHIVLGRYLIFGDNKILPYEGNEDKLGKEVE